MSFESFKAWGKASPNLLYIAAWFGAIVMFCMIVLLLSFVIPVDANLDDPVFEPMFALMLMIPLVMVVLPGSIAVLRIKHRSMWWLLLFLWYSPLWLSDSKQKCKTNHIYAILVINTIFLTDGLTYAIEYVQTNIVDAIFWYGFFIYFVSVILSDIANRGLEEDNNLAVENSTIHDVKDPEAKE
jgi:hypothetical protein